MEDSSHEAKKGKPSFTKICELGSQFLKVSFLACSKGFQFEPHLAVKFCPPPPRPPGQRGCIQDIYIKVSKLSRKQGQKLPSEFEIRQPLASNEDIASAIPKWAYGYFKSLSTDSKVVLAAQRMSNRNATLPSSLPPFLPSSLRLSALDTDQMILQQRAGLPEVQAPRFDLLALSDTRAGFLFYNPHYPSGLNPLCVVARSLHRRSDSLVQKDAAPSPSALVY